MTLKQDYINSILQSLASIALSPSAHIALGELDQIVSEYRNEIYPKGTHKVESVTEAIEILTAFDL